MSLGGRNIHHTSSNKFCTINPLASQVFNLEGGEDDSFN